MDTVYKRLLIYPFVIIITAVFAHLWATQPLFWKKIPYRIQAYKLAFSEVYCDSGTPARLADLLKYHALPNFALTGEVVYVDSSGKNYSCRVAPDGEKGNQFRLASMTKAITAHAVIRLAEEGRLGLGATLLSFFPEVDTKSLRDPRLAQVTISQLLNHSSGFGGPFGSDDMVKRGRSPWCPRDFRQLETVRLAGTPGTNYVYSNVSYCLLGEIVARAVGEPYRQYVEKRYLVESSVAFVDGEYLPDEPRYDFSNDFRFGRDYVNWLDFRALSSAAGLIGRPDDFARIIWERLHPDPNYLLNGPLVPGCGKDEISECYSWNFELEFDNQGDILAGVQQGYVPGVSSLLAITPAGQVLVWIAAGAPVEGRNKEQLQQAVVKFLAHESGKKTRGGG